jgi:hypothetical protein
MLSYIGLIGFEFTVIEMNKNNLKRGESLTLLRYNRKFFLERMLSASWLNKNGVLLQEQHPIFI